MYFFSHSPKQFFAYHNARLYKYLHKIHKIQLKCLLLSMISDSGKKKKKKNTAFRNNYINDLPHLTHNINWCDSRSLGKKKMVTLVFIIFFFYAGKFGKCIILHRTQQNKYKNISVKKYVTRWFTNFPSRKFAFHGNHLSLSKCGAASLLNSYRFHSTYLKWL